MLNHYQQKGWVHFKNVLLPRDIVGLKYHGGMVVEEYLKSDPVWKGVGCAAMENKHLWYFYTSPFMYDIVTELLETKTPWSFNDQLVWKYPMDGMSFHAHTDNSTQREDPIKDHTVNCLVIIDDIDDENGGLKVRNKDDGEWVSPKLKAGDIICINGNTEHASGHNRSDKLRAAYACVYADNNIKDERFYQTRFYDERKESETNAKGWYLEKERQEKLQSNESRK